MHIGGMGNEEKLASAAGKVFAALKEKGEVPTAEIDPAKSTIDPAKLDAVFGRKGEFKDGVYKATWGRTTKEHGMTVGNTMGVNTWAALAGSPEKAVVDGDFAMLESEMQEILKTLRHANINIVAIHSHMAGEQPRILFLHYWGVGPAEQLGQPGAYALEPHDRDVPAVERQQRQQVEHADEQVEARHDAEQSGGFSILLKL